MAAVEERHWWYTGMRQIVAAWLDPLKDEPRNLMVLDAGCGTGGNGEFMWRYGQPIGLDMAREALVLGQRRLPGRLAGGSVMDLPFSAASFDLVTSFDVLYHRAVIDEQTALRETWRVLKPGGYFLMRLPAYRWLSSAHDRRTHGHRRFTAGEVRTALDRAGFQLERLSYINSLLFPIPMLQRLLERLWPAEEDSDLLPPSPLINTLLRLVLQTEAAWLRQGGRFPLGLSILSLARKPELPTQHHEPTFLTYPAARMEGSTPSGVGI